MNQELILQLNQTFAGKAPGEIIPAVAALFPGKIAFATSFGAEDQVITHLIAKSGANIKLFTLDTGRMFPETYETMHRTVSRYQVPIQTLFPDREEVEAMVNEKGINLFYESIENRKLCCHIRKTQPLQRALQGMEAWITGLRREQSPTRQHLEVVEWDSVNRLLKINPLCDWTEPQVWEFIHAKNIPYNKLHDQGFPSIGCQPCTRAVAKGDDIRAGRWWWENPDSKECGLHQQ